MKSNALSSALPRPPLAPASANHTIGVLPGEGIGPEIIPVALALLRPVEQAFGCRFELRWGGAIGTPAKQRCGAALSDDVVQFCSAIFDDAGAVFCGPGGERFVYELRRRFDLYCKFTPIRPLPALQDIGVIRPEARRGVDMVVVRENTGGLYFGEWGVDADDTAFHRFEYRPEQVQRILAVAMALAAQRRGRLTVVLKPGGVPVISELWERVLGQLPRLAGVEVDVLEVDNAMYQMLAHAGAFDVVVAPNMFGDVLSDGAALLLGSRGMSFSGNFGPQGQAVYQTGHGAAHDLAGSGRANPTGQIHSLAMMLRESFAMHEAAAAIECALADTLAAGWRTADIATAHSNIVTTAELGRRVNERLEAALNRSAA